MLKYLIIAIAIFSSAAPLEARCRDPEAVSDPSLYERCKQIIEDEAVKQRGTGAYQDYLKRYPPEKLCIKFPRDHFCF